MKERIAWYGGGVVLGVMVIAAAFLLYGWTGTTVTAVAILAPITGVVYVISSQAAGWPTAAFWARNDSEQ